MKKYDNSKTRPYIDIRNFPHRQPLCEPLRFPLRTSALKNPTLPPLNPKPEITPDHHNPTLAKTTQETKRDRK
ncbi:MAG: hypothetical protein ACOC2Z_09325 [Coleofasciculus sp.]